MRAGLLALVLAAALAASAAASAAPRYVASDCRHLAQRPPTLILTCGDAGVQMFGLRWSSFGATAHGVGILSYRTCTPSCAAGGVRKVSRVRITLDSARRCRGGRLVFRRATLSFPGRRPSGVAARQRLGCPI